VEAGGRTSRYGAAYDLADPLATIPSSCRDPNAARKPNPAGHQECQVLSSRPDG
jgi:hypothetical protein